MHAQINMAIVKFMRHNKKRSTSTTRYNSCQSQNDSFRLHALANGKIVLMFCCSHCHEKFRESALYTAVALSSVYSTTDAPIARFFN